MGQHYRVTVSSKRQMTLPVKLYVELGIDPGTMLDVTTSEDGAIALHRRWSITELAGAWSCILWETSKPLTSAQVCETVDDGALERNERSRVKASR